MKTVDEDGRTTSDLFRLHNKASEPYLKLTVTCLKPTIEILEKDVK